MCARMHVCAGVYVFVLKRVCVCVCVRERRSLDLRQPITNRIFFSFVCMCVGGACACACVRVCVLVCVLVCGRMRVCVCL